MTSTRAILLVVSSALLFAIIGGGIGCGLGVFVPNYYRALYDGRGPYDDPDAPLRSIDPVQMGLGLGITQGFCGGIGCGLI